MPYKSVTLSLPADLLPVIDEAAKANYCTRSDYIREAVMQRLNGQAGAKSNNRPDAPSPLDLEEEPEGLDWV